jgi:hypothetical protein
MRKWVFPYKLISLKSVCEHFSTESSSLILIIYKSRPVQCTSFGSDSCKMDGDKQTDEHFDRC